MSFKTFNWKKDAGLSSGNLLDPSSNAAGSARSEETRLTRRKHKKSRKGCLTCKRRHIRCDENVPQCFNCTKGNRTCNYEAPENDEDDSAMNLGDESPDDTAATIVEQSGKNTSSSSLSHRKPPPESISNESKAASKRKLSTESLDPYGASVVRLTPSMREQLNYCKK